MYNQLGLNLDSFADFGDNKVFAGEANTSAEALQDLAKALEAGSITGQGTLNSSTASGAPLKMESLDGTLKTLTYTENEIVLWRKIPKTPAYNTVEEFNQLESYGEDRGGFNLEGELPDEEDSTYVRRAQLVKFLGVTKSVTHVMTLTRTMVGNVIAREAKNGTLFILRKLNRALHSGNSRIIPSEFNGMYAQHERPDGVTFLEGSLAAYFDSESVVDLRGGVLAEETIEDAQEAIIENFGLGTDIFAAPKVFSDFTKSFYGQKRFIVNSDAIAAGVVGQRTVAHDTEFGRVAFTHDIFMNKKKAITAATPATGSKAPATIVPDVGTPIAAVADSPASKWDAAVAGDYLYAVTAVNRHGESAPAVLDAAATTVAVDDSVDLTFAAGVGGEAATGFIIYRGEKDVSGASTKFFRVFEVSTADLTAGFDGGGAGDIRDRNHLLPNTNECFLIQNDAEIWTFRQLAPLMKMDLAITSPAYRFMVLLYGTPILFAPRKMTRIINIGVL